LSLIFRSGEENQCKAASLILDASGFHQAEFVAVKFQRLLEVSDSYHGVQKTHLDSNSISVCCFARQLFHDLTCSVISGKVDDISARQLTNFWSKSIDRSVNKTTTNTDSKTTTHSPQCAPVGVRLL
jgi:hypothetical protein